ncbi:MAG: division/cell wall cluster transcriptional repressor MraZ [Bacteroidota bacterium]
MKSLIGEYHCKLDAKGRFLMPSGLRKQLPEDQQNDFVINRGLDKCLVLWPLSVWEKESAKIRALNSYDPKRRAFQRMFFSGAREVQLDGSGRVLLTSFLIEHAGLGKALVLEAQSDRVEIWDKGAFEGWMEDPGYDFGMLAEEVMKDLGSGEGGQ